VVENKPGAATNLGADFVAKAAPDGYTGCSAMSRPMPPIRAFTRSSNSTLTPTHGYEATREAAMAAFRKSWQRDQPGGLPPGTGGHLVLFPRPRKGRLHALSQQRMFSAPLTNLANFFRA
jgi:hypothetical protein